MSELHDRTNPLCVIVLLIIDYNPKNARFTGLCPAAAHVLAWIGGLVSAWSGG